MHSSSPLSRSFRVRRVCLSLAAALLLLTSGMSAAEPPAPVQGSTTPSVVQEALQAVAEQTTPEVSTPAVQTASAMPAVPGEATPTAKTDTTVPLQMDWLLDGKGNHTLGDVLATNAQQAFRPYEPESLPHLAGSIWLRLAPEGKTPAFPLVLDLNTRIAGQLPGTPQVWLARSGESNGTPVRPSGDGLYHLPSPLPDRTNIYIRVNGIPAPGFAPLLRDVSSLTVLDELGTQPQLVLLAVLLFLCLLRGIAEHREWRMWAALYIAAVWVQAFWGLPTTPAGVVSRWDLPGLLAPGVALLILPHVGRHLMRTRLIAPFIDMQFILLALCGIALSVAPLVPGYTWTLQFLPLWPLFTLLLLPGTLAACLRRLPGAKRFFLVCLFPPLGMLALFPLSRILPDSIIGMLPHALDGFMAPGVISLIPLTCLSLSALVAALSPSPKPLPTPKRSARENAKTNKPGAATLELGEALKVNALPEERPQPSVDPTLLSSSFTPPPDAMRPHATMPAEASRQQIYPQSLQSPLSAGMAEDALRGPLDALLRAISAVDQAALPAEARRRTDALGVAGRNLARAVGNIGRPQAQRPAEEKQRFDLNQLLLDIHESVSSLAESKNIGLSWFTAPHLPRSYEGRRNQLADVLGLHVESAVLATERGSVQIRAQRLPESTDPGHLLFTVSDTGSGLPPLGRSTLALVRAWELVGPDSELVSLESGPKGTSISFSVRLTARATEQPAPAPDPEPDKENLSRLPASSLRIIVASSVPANRQLLSFYLDELPHEILEARTPEEAQAIYRRTPGALLVFDDDMPEEAIAKAVAAIRIFEGEHNFPLACILALVNNDGQIDALRRAGCTHFLKKPITRKGLRHLTLRLAPVSRRFKDEDAPEKPLPAKPTAKVAQPVSPDIPDLPELPEPPKTAPLTTSEEVAKPHKNVFASLFSPFQKKNAAPAAAEQVASAPLPDPAPLPEPAALPEPSEPAPKAVAPKAAPQPENAPKIEEAALSAPLSEPTVVEPKAAEPKAAALPEVETPLRPTPVPLPEPAVEALPDQPVSLEEPVLTLTDIEEPVTILTEQMRNTPKLSSVGDPIPVSNPTPAAPRPRPERLNPLEERAKRTPTRSNAPRNATEWVGEPMPILKNAQEQAAEKAPLTLSAPVTPPDERPAAHLRLNGDAELPLLLDAPLPELHEPRILDGDALLLDSPIQDGETPVSGKPETRPAPGTTPSVEAPLPDLFGTLAAPAAAPRSLLDEASRLTPCEQGSRPVPGDGDMAIEDIVDLGTPLSASPATSATSGPEVVAELASPEHPAEAHALETPVSTEQTTEQTVAEQNSENQGSEGQDPEEQDPEEQAADEAIREMLSALDEALEQALHGQLAGDAQGVCAAAARIGQLAEAYDLRTLDDPARCLEEAARSGNMDEVAQLVPDLVAAITRNRAAFTGQEH